MLQRRTHQIRRLMVDVTQDVTGSSGVTVIGHFIVVWQIAECVVTACAILPLRVTGGYDR